MPAKFHEILSMGLQDFKETKRYVRTDGRTHARTDGQRENSIPPLKLRFGGGGGIIKACFKFTVGMNFIFVDFIDV